MHGLQLLFTIKTSDALIVMNNALLIKKKTNEIEPTPIVHLNEPSRVRLFRERLITETAAFQFLSLSLSLSLSDCVHFLIFTPLPLVLSPPLHPQSLSAAAVCARELAPN